MQTGSALPSRPWRKLRTLGHVAVLLLAVLLIVACGSDDASSGTPGTGASTNAGGAAGGGAAAGSGGTTNSGGNAGAGGSGSGGFSGSGSSAGASGAAGVGGASGAAGAGGSAGSTGIGGSSSGGTGGGGSQQRWGAGWSMDSLANTALQNSHDTVTMRFRAKYTGVIQSIRAFYMGPDKPGYGKGSPSGVELSIQGDGHGTSALGHLSRTFVRCRVTELLA
jgi:hypothetical protein